MSKVEAPWQCASEQIITQRQLLQCNKPKSMAASDGLVSWTAKVTVCQCHSQQHNLPTTCLLCVVGHAAPTVSSMLGLQLIGRRQVLVSQKVCMVMFTCKRNLKTPAGRVPVKRLDASPSLLMATVSVMPVEATTCGLREVKTGAGSVPENWLWSRYIDIKAGASNQSLGRAPVKPKKNACQGLSLSS